MANPERDVEQLLDQAIARGDLQALIDLYEENAQIQVIDRTHVPVRSHTVQGKESIQSYYRRVLPTLKSPHHLGYTSRNMDGSPIAISVTIARTSTDGKISREVDLQEWDESH